MSKEANSVEHALKLALEALKTLTEGHSVGGKNMGEKAIKSLETALAKQEQSTKCVGEPVAKKVAECLAVLRPALAGKFPHEQALEELVSYTHQQLKVDKHTDDLCQVLIQKTHIQERQIAELQAQLVAQPKQEPVAWCRYEDGMWVYYETKAWDDLRPLYTTPQPVTESHKRKPLTDEQIRKASLEAGMQEHYMGFHSGFTRFTRIIEAAHGIKE